jgi:sugar lactone lactonase YvrE
MKLSRDRSIDVNLLFRLGAVLFLTLNCGAQPMITIQPTNQMAVYGGNVTFSVTATDAGPLIYQWQLNVTNIFTNGIITTVAGNGNNTYSGDGGVATSAGVSNPDAVAVDRAGNFFIADKIECRIRRVDTNGIISTIAGNGSNGFSGDGGSATNASINQPLALAVDSFGNLFIADSGNRVRKVDTNGIITTVAGKGNAAFAGDGGAATNASVANPSGVAVDTTGNIFIADQNNQRIRIVNTNGIISTFAGNGSLGFSGDGGVATNAMFSLPNSVALDDSGNLFIADQHRIRVVNTNGIIATVAGNGSVVFSGDGGAATNASLAPQGIFVDAFGYIYIADPFDNRIRQVDANGIITTIAGIGGSGVVHDGGYATNSSLNYPEDVALDNSGNLLIADTDNNRVRKIITGRNPLLTLANVTVNNVGSYQVIVTGPDGSITSSNASLTLLSPPSITTEPSYARIASGSSFNFNVSVDGTPPFSYQWFTSSGSSALAAPVVSSGYVTSASLITGGIGYSSAPQVHFVGGSGNGASATASVLSGSVHSIFITSQGSGYTTPPTIHIDPPPAINALLSGQTNSVLTIPSVTLANLTNYFVVVTNNYGAVTSDVVRLNVFLPPQNFTIQNLPTGLQMQLTGTRFNPYVLQSATNLTPPIGWTSIVTNLSDVNGNWQFTDTNLNADQKYYRAFGQ